MLKLLKTLLLLLALSLGNTSFAGEFDHNYTAWNSLLAKHVKWLPDNKQTAVDYAGFQKDRQALKTVLNDWSSVSQAEFGVKPYSLLMGTLRVADEVVVGFTGTRRK